MSLGQNPASFFRIIELVAVVERVVCLDLEMKRFFMAVQMVGVDFHMMMSLIPDRSHKELRVKFMTIDRTNRALIDKYLGRPLKYDKQLLISRYKAELRSLDKVKYEKRKLKLRFEAKRRNDRELFEEWFLERDFVREAEELAIIKAEKKRLETGIQPCKRKKKKSTTSVAESPLEMPNIEEATKSISDSQKKGPKKRKISPNEVAVDTENPTEVVGECERKKPKKNGRPPLKCESSIQDIEKSIEAAIKRYQNFKDPPSLLTEAPLDVTVNEFNLCCFFSIASVL